MSVIDVLKYGESKITDTPKTLLEVFADFWQARGFVLAGILAGAVFAAAFIFSAVPHYRAQMIVSPANPMNGAEVSSLLADDNLFALRYLAQRVGVSNSSDFMRFETTYAGPSVAGVLLQDEGVVLGLLQDKSFSFSKIEKVWSNTELAEYIDENVRFGHVGTTTQRRMTYSHPSPEFAVYFLHHIHRVTDELIRLNIRQSAIQRVSYLEEAITKTLNPEHKRALTTLLLEQERLRMLVSIETPYAASVIEPPAVLSKPVWPDPALVYALFMIAGAVLGFTAYGLRCALRDEKNAAQKTSGEQKRWYKDDSLNSNEKPADEETIRAA